jgi:hypothetical protein
MPCFKEENKPKDYMYFIIFYDYDLCLPFIQTSSACLLEKAATLFLFR